MREVDTLLLLGEECGGVGGGEASVTSRYLIPLDRSQPFPSSLVRLPSSLSSPRPRTFPFVTFHRALSPPLFHVRQIFEISPCHNSVTLQSHRANYVNSSRAHRARLAHGPTHGKAKTYKLCECAAGSVLLRLRQISSTGKERLPRGEAPGFVNLLSGAVEMCTKQPAREQ